MGGTARLTGFPRIGQDRGSRWACRHGAGGGSTISVVRKHTNTNGSRVARKHTHPACAQARQVASQRHHTPVDESHPPLEATVCPAHAAVGRSQTGVPLPLIHDRPANNKVSLIPHYCRTPVDSVCPEIHALTASTTRPGSAPVCLAPCPAPADSARARRARHAAAVPHGHVPHVAIALCELLRALP